MSKFSIRSSFISKNKIIDDRIEIHIPITSKILFCLRQSMLTMSDCIIELKSQKS